MDNNSKTKHDPLINSSTSSVSVASTQADTVPPAPKKLPAWMLSSASNSVSSASRRICRICQMEAGNMVRPCDCAGTMGDVHEECLTKWVNISNKKNCEICKSEYAKSGAVFKPMKEWTKPKVDVSVLASVVILVSLLYLLIYIYEIMKERFFFERIIHNKLLWRPDDTGRIVLVMLICLSLIHNIYVIGTDSSRYLKSQRHIRFVNKHPQN